jgi:serine/threonine protein kinase
LPLANRKAKCLRSVLQNQARALKLKIDIPYIEPLIFCSARQLTFDLDEIARKKVTLRDEHASVQKKLALGVRQALEFGRMLDGGRFDYRHDIQAKELAPLLRVIGKTIQPGSRRYKVGDYRLVRLLDEGPGYQDWLAEHQTMKELRRRARCYLVQRGSDKADRERIRRAAEREFRVLQGLRHQGILPVHDFIEGEGGPVLLFDYNETAQRLDHWLVDQKANLDPGTILDLMEKLVDAVRAAHAHHLLHRALAPRSILVTPQKDAAPLVQLFNWQTGLRHAESTNAASVAGTVHVDALIEDSSAAYIAPEAISNPEQATEQADVFSLGALAYRLFANRAPAASHLELINILQQTKGLSLSAAVNGVLVEQDNLVFLSTQANPVQRSSLEEFSQRLSEVWDKFTEPTLQDSPASPLDAQPKNKLRDDNDGTVYEVTERIGMGASSLVLRVNDPEGKPFVLKLARSQEYEETVRQEHALLNKLRDRTIVRVHKLTKIGGIASILMDDCGESLASFLRAEGRLSLDMLQTLGEDLIRAADYLESQGVFHRDIKPENMGIQKAERTAAKRSSLILFDFSLATVPASSISSGTRNYMDPFLPLRKPPAYDTQAERYAAAVSLYQMATGCLPQWGDGQSNPAADKGCKLVLEGTLFPAPVRDGLMGFFDRALNRDFKDGRFDNAREMLIEWMNLFQEAESPSTPHPQVSLEDTTLDTELAACGLSTRAFNALDRLNIVNVRALLQLAEYDLIARRGVGYKVKREILDLQRKLKERFPEVEVKELPPVTDSATLTNPNQAGVDYLYDKICKKFGREEKAHDYRLHLLGAEEIPGLPAKRAWPTQAEVAEHTGVTRPTISLTWQKSTTQWKRLAIIRTLADTMAEILSRQGGVMTAEEMAEAVPAARGCSGSRRREMSLTVIRAALACEEDADEPRFTLHRRGNVTLIAAFSELADYAERLGAEADGFAKEFPPPSPGRILERLQSVWTPPPEAVPGWTGLPEQRLLTLAAAASQQALLTPNRQEFYLAGLPAEKALNLAKGVLTGLQQLDPQEIRRRVAERYPGAELLPDHPRLLDLLRAAGFDLTYAATQKAYVQPVSTLTSFSGKSLLHQYRAPTAPEEAHARACQQRLEGSLAQQGFMVLQVNPHSLLCARAALLQRFRQLQPFDGDELFIAAMKETAQKKNVKWPVVLKADHSTVGSSEWSRLQQLVGLSVATLREKLLSCSKPVLLCDPGLFARYGHMSILENLRDTCGTGKGPPGCWVLLPSTGVHSLPMVDHVPLPVIGTGQYMVLPAAWVNMDTKRKVG